MPPLLWIGLGIIVVMALARQMRQGEDQVVPVADYFQRQDLAVVRSASRAHAFPSLGVKIDLPKGWTYLSVVDDIVSHPTFVNESHPTIVRLHPLTPETWPDQMDVEVQQLEDANIEWIDASLRRLKLTVERSGLQLQHQWIQRDPRSVGRLTRGQSRIAVVAITHGVDPAISQPLRDFCSAIDFTDQ